MRAVVHERYGPPHDVLRVSEAGMPAAGAGSVLVQVHAAGVNPADCAGTRGLPYIARPAFGLRAPRNPVRGTDFAGTVEAVGPDVTRFTPGDAVLGVGRGTFAEYTLAGEDKVVSKPHALTFAQAASMPMAGLTALQALRDHANVKPGDSVLVNGASGGVGTFAVQIAKALGAEVTGVCSTAKVDLVRSIGADHVLDYTRDDFTRGRTYDVILDNAVAEDLLALTELVEAGKLAPAVDRAFTLEEAADALVYLERGLARGKVVITA